MSSYIKHKDYSFYNEGYRKIIGEYKAHAELYTLDIINMNYLDFKFKKHTFQCAELLL